MSLGPVELGVVLVLLLVFLVVIGLAIAVVIVVARRATGGPKSSERECPQCGWYVKRGLTECPKCGHDFAIA